MGIIKKILKVSFGYGIPAILIMALLFSLDPTTVWQWFTAWIICFVVYSIVAFVTTTIADKW